MDNNRKRFGSHLRELRLEAALTQEVVSENLGYSSAQFISNWERGVALPPVDVLPAFARLVGRSAKRLVNELYDCKVALVEDERRAALRDMAS
jgi:transcriptional regulator with XRE-family HTH domain